MANRTFGSPIGCLGFVLCDVKNAADNFVNDASP